MRPINWVSLADEPTPLAHIQLYQPEHQDITVDQERHPVLALPTALIPYLVCLPRYQRYEAAPAPPEAPICPACLHLLRGQVVRETLDELEQAVNWRQYQTQRAEMDAGG